jgi:uncharacterized repeat protein (TIGR01451 family)
MPIGSAVFTVTVAVSPSLAAGTIITNTAVIGSATTDPNPGNENGVATTTVAAGSADLSIAKIDTPDPVNAGSSLAYTITVNNAGPGDAATVVVNDTLPTGTTFVSLSSPLGWSCTTPAVGATGTISCSIATFAPGSAVFTLNVNVSGGAPSLITNTATITSATGDPNPGNESATATTTVLSPANVSGTKTATGTFAQGSTITYTIVLSNSGSAAQGDNPGNEFTDVLPAQLTLVSATATSGTAVAAVGTNTVTWNGSIPAAGSVTISIQATINNSTPAGTTVTNQGTISFDADGNGTNESSSVTDDPSQPGSGQGTGFVVLPAVVGATVDAPALDALGLAALAALLAGVALLILRRT